MTMHSENSMASSERKKVLSKLIATRDIIKSKFKKAYTDRVKRESKLGEIMKPVAKLFADEFIKKGAEKKDKNEAKDNVNVSKEFKTPFKPKRLVTSTPKSILRKRHGASALRRYNKSGNRKNSASNEFIDADGTLFHSLESSEIDETPILSSDKRIKNRNRNRKKDSIGEYTYEVDRDDDSNHNYSKSPPDNMTVYGYKTHKSTGVMEPMSIKWNKLPLHARQQWLRDRAAISAAQKSREKSVEVIEDEDLVEEIETAASNKKEPPIFSPKTRSQKRAQSVGHGLNKNKSIDINFIPYNKNDHIIYEYFDDPNELCDRLRLLVSSKMAGNTNHMQEVNSIIEELRELKYIG